MDTLDKSGLLWSELWSRCPSLFFVIIQDILSQLLNVSISTRETVMTLNPKHYSKMNTVFLVYLITVTVGHSLLP